MPPAMTSAHSPVRSSNTSGTMSRREPLRRLYPLQRARTISDSIREMGNYGIDENTPTAIVVDTDTILSQKRRGAQRLSSNPIVTVPQYKLMQQRHPSASPDRSNERQVYTRPSLIRRSSDIGSISSYTSSCPVHSTSDFSSDISRQGSILKRPNSQRGRGRDCVLNLRQVKFCPNVSVVHMDEDGEHLGTHFQELNGEKRNHMSTLSRQPSRNYDNRNYDNVIYITDDSVSLQQDKSQAHDSQRRSSIDHQISSSQPPRPDSVRFRELFKRINNGGGSLSRDQGEANVPLKRGQFNITFSNRAGEMTKLRFVLHMGQDYNPNDLVVKANTTGSRIRVLATHTDRNSHLTEEFNEKYMLPMDIDPYEIEARLDKMGNLTVEAPLMTVDKRAEVSKTNNVLCAIYV